MWVTKQLQVPIDFHIGEKNSMGSTNCLVAQIRQNIFFCDQQRKEIDT